MLKVMFVPFRVAGGLIGGALATRVFTRVWSLIDSNEPPAPDQRGVSVGKLAASLALQGAVFKGVRGLVDHGARQAFRRTTGRWPGEKKSTPGS